ncbi:PAS domain S-box protein [Sneathiella aquimaris]|uniref:PAS domain S-box protein n=1 Tax=Sneathiella aquimaris TaxID=2599305 RepID=UPI00146DD17B|nr:PAS domain S-box protein [Sneathiella aquimaris]
MTVAKKLILSIVGFSLIVTLLSTGVQLYVDYLNNIEEINADFEDIQETRLPNLTHNVWVLDEEQIILHLKSLVNTDNIEFATISDDGTARWNDGVVRSERTIKKSFPLVLENNGQSFNLGTLTVVAGLNQVFANLQSRAVVILGSNAVVIFLFASFLLIIFQYQISRHLLTLSNFAQNLKFDANQPALKLQRKNNPENPDELDDVVSALNLMQRNIEKSYLALRESEEYNRMLFEKSPIGLALKHTNGEFVDVNPAFARILGYSSEELTKMSLWDVTPKDFYEQESLQIHLLERNKRLHPFEKEVIHKDGSLIPVQVWYFYLERHSQKYIAATMEDISERKKSELALAKSEEQLRQSEKMRAVGELTGGVAHDFNNLLAVVLGNAELLEEKLPDDADEQSYLRTLMSAAARGAELTRRLLAFSRKQMLNPTVTDIPALVDNMAGMLKRVLGENILVETQYDNDLWKCKVDQGQLENAILNLAINSRDSLQHVKGRAGRLTIVISNTLVDEFTFEKEHDVAPGEYLLISVSDNGQGMPRDILDRVFEPFFTTKPVGEGTGLGLSMIYGFVKQSGGHVSIYSEENIGTSVKLFLPRANEDIVEKIDEMEEQQPQTGNETILVLEDDPDVRELTVLQLKSLGYNVKQAHDGHSALEVINSESKIDLLLSDVVLPGGLRGPEVAQKAREIKPNLSVLFMSGYTQNALDAHPEIGESSLLLNKPFRKRELAEKIREAIEI